jgi:pilus assembly protein Flp/PilA
MLLHRSLKPLVVCCPRDATYEECLAVTGIIRRFVTDERGATAVEYGLIVALVSLAAGGVVMQLGDIVQLIYEYILGNVEEAATP